MSGVIVQSKHIVTLLGGGEASSSVLETLRAQSDLLVAADGGARHALAAGWIPDAVIGDMDSLDAASRARLPAERIHHVPEQDSTDFEKCLTRIAAPLVLGTGFLGPRTDHMLACFHGLLVHGDRRAILVSESQLVFLCPPDLSIKLPEGSLVSLFPLRRVAAQSEGLHWPVAGLDLAPGRIIGTSNRVSTGGMRLSCDRSGLLVILPRPALAAAQAALLRSAPWPARAG